MSNKLVGKQVDLLGVRKGIMDLISSVENIEITDSGYGLGGFDVGFVLDGIQYDMWVSPRTKELE